MQGCCAQLHLDCSTPATVLFFHGAKNEKLRIPDFSCCVWSNRKNQVRWNDSSGVSVIDKKCCYDPKPKGSVGTVIPQDLGDASAC